MLYGESGNEKPEYTLGPKFRSLIIAIVWFAVSLYGVYLAGNLFAAVHGVNTSGNIYFAYNYAGFLSILSIVLSFSTVFAAMTGLGIGIFMLINGNLDLYQDYAVWKKRGSKRRVEYSEFTDAYFGYQAVPTGQMPGTPGYGPTTAQYSVSRLISFYIGNKRFNFSPRRKPGLTKFLESKIPKSNIDVEDDGPETSSS